MKKKDPLDVIGVKDFYGRNRDSPIRKAKLVVRARKHRNKVNYFLEIAFNLNSVGSIMWAYVEVKLDD